MFDFRLKMPENNSTENLQLTLTQNLPLDRNPAAVYLASLRVTGRRSVQHHLTAIAKMVAGEKADCFSFPWQTLRYQHTAAIQAQLRDKYRTVTANQMIKALRRVLHEAWNLGLMEAEEYRRAANIKLIKGQSLPSGRALKEAELLALLKICQKDKGPGGTRDFALIAVMYSTGLRRSELVALDLAHYDFSEKSLNVKSGKGGKERLVFLEDGAAEALNSWLVIRKDEPGALFLPINKGGNISQRRLTDQAILWILEKRAKEAGVNHFSPHDLRRTFISDLLEAGADISTVQKMAGHANVTTTARYDRRGDEAQKKAASLLRLPLNPDLESEPLPS